jgi:hypothetical protein
MVAELCAWVIMAETDIGQEVNNRGVASAVHPMDAAGSRVADRLIGYRP